MKETIHYSNKSALTGCLLLWVIIFFSIPVSGFAKDLNKENSVSRTAEARMAVEQAWEIYHHGALGGTLASPAIQTELEMNLHKSRTLLAQAYEAEERGDRKHTDKLVKQIIQISRKVITESQEPKK
ncbi:MAG: hypothetical protein NPINA01_18820 [Nitrospinaceae bacterium]|nr:MAG: hypothetical protein NPINA01_18820 [Nitrospinaceae bacterium]